MFEKIKGEASRSLNIVALALPVCIGFGEISGIGAVSGIIGLVIALIVGALLGGVTGVIRTPLISLTLIISLIIDDLEYQAGEKAFLIFYTIVAAGLFQVLIGKLRLSKYVKLIPHPVISGALSSMGILGVYLSFQDIFILKDPLVHQNIHTAIIVFITIATILLIEWKAKKLPSLLLALVVPTIAYLSLGFDLPQISFDLNSFSLPQFSIATNFTFIEYFHETEHAVVLAFTGLIETLLCALIADNISGERHSGEKELTSLGVSNIISGALGGLPVGANTAITIVNVKEKERNRFRPIYAALMVILIVPLLGTQLKLIPSSVISAIIIYLSILIIDFSSLKAAIFERTPDHFVLVTTILVGVFHSIIAGIIMGFVVASILFMYKMSKLVETLTEEGEIDNLVSDHKMLGNLSHEVHVINLNGPLFFGYADSFYGLFHHLDGIKVFIVNLKEVPYMDNTGLEVITKAINLVKEKQVDIYFVGANDLIYSQFEKQKIIGGLLSENSFFPRLKGCLKMLNAEYKEHLKENHE